MRSNLTRPLIRRSSIGFTLIELLIVISIMAVLMAILIPAINTAYGAAAGTVCLSNARQLAVATQAYAVDHRRVLPGLPGGSPTYWVPSLVGPYMNGNREIWKCPESESASDEWNGVASDWSASYGYNTFGLRYARLSSIRKPTQTVAWIESRNGDTATGHSLIMPTAGIPGYGMGLPRYRHDSGRLASIAMLDGHSEAMTFDTLEATAATEDNTTLASGTIDPYLRWNKY